MHNARSHCITKNILHASVRTELEIAREREGALASVYKQILTCIYECCLSAGECCGNALGCHLHGPSHNAPGWAGEYPAEWSWGWWAHTVTFGPVSRMFLHMQMCTMNCGRFNIHLIYLILQIILTRWWCTTRMFCWTWLMSVLRTRLLSHCAIISPVWMIHTSGVGGASDTWFSIIQS